MNKRLISTGIGPTPGHKKAQGLAPHYKLFGSWAGGDAFLGTTVVGSR
jgi:hypothetical protein